MCVCDRERERGRESDVPRNLCRQEGTPLQLIGYINSIFSAFDREVKKQVDSLFTLDRARHPPDRARHTLNFVKHTSGCARHTHGCVGHTSGCVRHTTKSAGRTPLELIGYINSIFSAFDREVKKRVREGERATSETKRGCECDR